MGLKLKIAGFFVFILFCSLELKDDLSKRDKKLNSFIGKSYKDKTVIKKVIEIPDSVMVNFDNYAYGLMTSDSLIGYLLYTKALGCRVGGCAAEGVNASQDNHDPYYFATIYNLDLTIKEIKVIEYYSEYGVEITSRRWLKQFANKVGCNLEVNKNVDGISGATISVKSMLKEINLNCDLIQYISNN